MKVIEAAGRRKCGQIFLKSLALAQTSEQTLPNEQNLYARRSFHGSTRCNVHAPYYRLCFWKEDTIS